MADTNEIFRRAQSVLKRLGANDEEAKRLADEMQAAISAGLPGSASSMHTRVHTSEMDAGSSFSASAAIGRNSVPGSQDRVPGPQDSVPGGQSSVSGGQSSVSGGSDSLSGGQNSISGAR